MDRSVWNTDPLWKIGKWVKVVSSARLLNGVNTAPRLPQFSDDDDDGRG